MAQAREREAVGVLEPLTARQPGMLDAWEQYLADGGRGMYLGSNGFYWVTSWHPEKPWLIEVRKCEQGSRAWQAKPGEYHHSTSGEIRVNLAGGVYRLSAPLTLTAQDSGTG